jgi:acyl-CoA synthetase (NDP forming)
MDRGSLYYSFRLRTVRTYSTGVVVSACGLETARGRLREYEDQYNSHIATALTQRSLRLGSNILNITLDLGHHAWSSRINAYLRHHHDRLLKEPKENDNARLLAVFLSGRASMRPITEIFAGRKTNSSTLWISATKFHCRRMAGKKEGKIMGSSGDDDKRARRPT